MSHSIFTGRPWSSGDPLFLREDTDAAIALAEEEQATCPSCGLLKVWCRDRESQFTFEVDEEQCHVTYALTAHRLKASEGRDEATNRAVQLSARLREGVEPDPMAGLGLEGGNGPEGDAE